MLKPLNPVHQGQVQALLPAELEFYSAYDWCLDPHLTVGEAVEYLLAEIESLSAVAGEWQLDEVAANVFLLSCALLNGVDEYLRGPSLRLPKPLASWPIARGARSVVEKLIAARRLRLRAQARRWRQNWQAALHDFLVLLAAGASDRASFAQSGEGLKNILHVPLPRDLEGQRLGVPSAFSRLDLTHFDILTLGRRFIQRFPDRAQPLLVLGLRTGGTYFAALLQALFKVERYQRVCSLTVHPKKGAGDRERRQLSRYAAQGFTVVIVDDPPHTGDTFLLALDITRRAGFGSEKVRLLAPTHPAKRDWSKFLPEQLVVSLEPEQWHKHQLLGPDAAQRRMSEYYLWQDFIGVRLTGSSRSDELNARLRGRFGIQRGAPLRRIYELQLRTAQGHMQTRYVLAESVGLGWLGYHALLAAHRLSGFVSPRLGLRDGIVYSEWDPQSLPAESHGSQRVLCIATSASYIATRARFLGLPAQRQAGKAVHENGLRLLAEVLSRAYGRFLGRILMQSRLQQRLCRRPCPTPALIDANMDIAKWKLGADGLRKAGYACHGLGKTELNVIDPAYDLAETILSLELSAAEESQLIQHYIEHSGDTDVGQRLFISKLLAGLWTMQTAKENLFAKPELASQQQEFHRQFIKAWSFLSVQTARLCGSYCRPSQPARWRSPLVALDVDGVLDRRIFGYPCTTAAGMEALRLLAARGFCVTLNTARSVAEVKSYCQAYGLAGGVAEYGAYLWDAVHGRGRVAISAEAMQQLDELKMHLQRLPGVFLDDRHQYSIRAFTYEEESDLLLGLAKSLRSFSVGRGRPTPLPSLLMNGLLESLRLDRLSFHHTTIDTTIVANDVDKGTGLLALRDWALGAQAETIAVGDSASDLPMFRVATRSFAPAHIDCARQARLLGCRISRHPYQRGLLDIARGLALSAATGAAPRLNDTKAGCDEDRFFLELLRAADRRNVGTLISCLFDRATFTMVVH